MCSCKCKNEYVPYKAKIESIREETADTKTFRIVCPEKDITQIFQYKQGQFMEISVFGAGEAPISITSSPSQRGFMEFTIRATGKVTNKIHDLAPGDSLYLRGPYGNAFPFEEIKGKNLFFIAGGIGLAPLRSLINLVFDNRKDFGRLRILYGAKTPADMCFKEEIEQWKSNSDTEIWLTVDKPCDGWGCSVGVVTELWKEVNINPENAVSIVCGPPIMMKFVVQKLLESGFPPEDIVMTLERYMKCGIGKCGHCNIAEKFVCIDGPVFSWDEVRTLPHKEAIF